jgi:hypothetical protein
MVSSSKRVSLAAKWLAMQFCRCVGARQTADVLYARRLEGFLSTPKVKLLYRVVNGLAGPGQIGEIGSWKGKSTVVLSLAAKRAGRGETVYAIDHHLGITADPPEEVKCCGGSDSLFSRASSPREDWGTAQ